MKIAALMTGSLMLVAWNAQAANYEDYARVRSVTPQYERVSAPRQECYTEYQSVPVTQERSYGGAIVGGVAGAILGAQVGKGNGNKAATAVGAATGAIVGDRIQNDRQATGWEERPVQRCREVENYDRRLNGYRVAYQYGGREYTTVLPYDPGRRLKVRVSVDPVEGDRW